ncbi:MAG TPA: ECF-type sigma factor [Bryobacteraceae bacterium]|jgi:RNA polymerase sigma factor (TIGR02999 family)|nr:ECF-type sigma factor [Bryobacteraceae bacterium]
MEDAAPNITQKLLAWQDRAHFFGPASNLMRCILVDHYRNKHALKRGGDARPVALEAAPDSGIVDWKEHILELDMAMNRLAALDPEQARTVELRFFGGLNVDEAAEVMGVPPATVKNRWSMARAWLHRGWSCSRLLGFLSACHFAIVPGNRSRPSLFQPGRAAGGPVNCAAHLPSEFVLGVGLTGLVSGQGSRR